MFFSCGSNVFVYTCAARSCRLEDFRTILVRMVPMHRGFSNTHFINSPFVYEFVERINYYLKNALVIWIITYA